MSTATKPNTTPTRRSALGFSAAAIVAGLTVPALAIPPTRPNPDAELVAIGREAATLVDEFNRCSAAFFTLPDGDPTLVRAADAGDPSFFRLEELVTQVTPLRATTLIGLAAKAILLRHLIILEFGTGGVFVSDDTPLTDLMWSLTYDLAGSAEA
jgi:hypothetical protein